LTKFTIQIAHPLPEAKKIRAETRKKHSNNLQAKYLNNISPHVFHHNKMCTINTALIPCAPPKIGANERRS
jgi:hypothetical protein